MKMNNIIHTATARACAARKRKQSLWIALITAIALIAPATPTQAATAAGNSADGYSVPASLTLKVGETKKLSVTEPKGHYANVSFQYDPCLVTASGYKAGSYWDKPAEISLKGKKVGMFTAYVTIR